MALSRNLPPKSQFWLSGTDQRAAPLLDDCAARAAPALNKDASAEEPKLFAAKLRANVLRVIHQL